MTIRPRKNEYLEPRRSGSQEEEPNIMDLYPPRMSAFAFRLLVLVCNSSLSSQSLVPRSSPPPVFDCFQYTNKEEGKSY